MTWESFDLEAAHASLRAAGSRGALTHAFSSIIKSLGYLGFDAFSVQQGTVHSPRTANNFIIHDYKTDLVNDYIDGGRVQSDMSLQIYANSTAPFDYIDFLRKSRKNTSLVWQLAMAKAMNVHHAWAFPLSTVGAIRGVTVYKAGSSPSDVEAFHQTRDVLHLLASRVFECLDQLHLNSMPGLEIDALQTSEDFDISAREADCLHWAAQGKTNWEIAQILGISENTVRFHFKNIYKKLGCNSRLEAVRMAAKHGLVSN